MAEQPKRGWVGLTPIEFNSIKDTATTIGYAITKTEVMLKEKNQREWIGLDPEQMRNTPIEFNRGALWAERYLKEKNYG